MTSAEMHPNSLANLTATKWRPGESGNPGGMPKHYMTPRMAYRRLAGVTSMDDLQEIDERKHSEGWQAHPIAIACAGMLLDLIENRHRFVMDKNGNLCAAGVDPTLVRWLSDFTDRLDGKPAQHITVDHHIIPPPDVLQRQLAERVATMDDDQRARLADVILHPEKYLADHAPAALPAPAE